MPRGIEGLAWLLGGCALAACADGPDDSPPGYLTAELSYGGSAVCAPCHERQYELWRGSHHHLAMQEVGPGTVLGDFDDAAFEHFGAESAFSRRGGEYWVRTGGPDGAPADYRVAYAFGAEPLQQYLIELYRGRLQALSIAWDARPAAEGGQRWFHLYPDEAIRHDDPLHWTGPEQNWNYMCAECHSTNLRRGYDAATGTYATTWDEIDVACEACHGPGSRHVAWAEEVAASGGSRGVTSAPGATEMGLVVRLKDADEAVWSFDQGGIARRVPPRTSHLEVEACGRCHSRRAVIRDPYVYGRPLLDSHRVALLTPDLYHPDGQIREEVYVYGSFLQSRMYAAGVTCSDCHDPHSGGLHSEGNALCARCHLPAKYDTAEHHQHLADGAASECVACHMRSETYMVVDPRRDHSFRVPRPDLSLEIATPNACLDCHRETSPEWAAERFVEWWPERAARPHYGQALHAAAAGYPGAAAALERLVADAAQPGIVRATAVGLLAEHVDGSRLAPLERATRDGEALVRMAAAGALEGLDAPSRLALGRPLLEDPVLAVRVEAARALAELPAEQLAADDRAALEGALGELRRVQLVNAERPESRIVLGAIHARQGRLAEARAEYEAALALDPRSVAARINLADLERQAGDDRSAVTVLRQALALAPGSADAHHALGLALVRLGRSEEAIGELGRAAALAPESVRYAYVHAVAVHSTGDVRGAISLLEPLHRRRPANREVLVALASSQASLGALAEAEAYARKLVDLSPGDPQALALLEQIRAGRR